MIERKEAEKKFKVGLDRIKDTHRTKRDRKKIPSAIKELKEELGLNRSAKGKQLDWIEDSYMEGYLTDMIFVQAYASLNRKLMMDRICHNLGWDRKHEVIESVHNYVDFNDFIIRKGAISSYEGQMMIIPFNMEDGLLICEGKSNPDWNFSAPHGAGRLFPRKKAKAKFSSKKTMERMHDKGIYTSAVPADEVKEAYKDPKIIEEAIRPTAEIISRVKPILNLKEGEDKK